MLDRFPRKYFDTRISLKLPVRVRLDFFSTANANTTSKFINFKSKCIMHYHSHNKRQHRAVMYKDIGEKSNRIIRIKECEPCEKNIARKPGGYQRKLQLKT